MTLCATGKLCSEQLRKWPSKSILATVVQQKKLKVKQNETGKITILGKPTNLQYIYPYYESK